MSGAVTTSTVLTLACLSVTIAPAYSQPGACSGPPGAPMQPAGGYDQTSAGGTGCAGRPAKITDENGQSGGTGGNAPDINLAPAIQLTATGGADGKGSTEYGGNSSGSDGGRYGGAGGNGGSALGLR